MRQAVLEYPRRLVVSESVIPVPSANDLLVEIKVTAICGTDRGIYGGDAPVHYPRVQGHEAAGVVQIVGNGVTDFSPGDRVAINPNRACNDCEKCLVGKDNLCSDAGLMGRDTDGTLREYLVVPQDQAFKLPSRVSFEEGALVQPLSTAVHGQRRANIKHGDSVVVVGLVVLGLMHVQLANLAGAFPVIAVGRSRWKLDLA